MSCKIFSFALLVLCIQLDSVSSFDLDAVTDARWTSAINNKLCGGTHSDEVAAKFDACYDDVVGGKQYKECQDKVYGGPMNTQAAIDQVCTSGKFMKYATCILGKFATHRINPLEAVHELAECQGGVLGVARP